jgi:hypothetical protein
LINKTAERGLLIYTRAVIRGYNFIKHNIVTEGKTRDCRKVVNTFRLTQEEGRLVFGTTG